MWFYYLLYILLSYVISCHELELYFVAGTCKLNSRQVRTLPKG